MPSRVIPLDVNQVKINIATLYAQLMRDILLQELDRILRPEYESTVQFWNSSGDNKFPVPVFQVRLEQATAPSITGFEFQFFSQMVERLGQTETHLLWSTLDFGSKPYTRPSPWIKRRNPYRTRGSGLSDRPFGTYEDSYFRFEVGEQFVGNDYSRKIARIIESNWNDPRFDLRVEIVE